MKVNASKLYSKLIIFSLCGIIFTLHFSKAAMQVFVWFAILSWLIEKVHLRPKDGITNTRVYLPLLIFVVFCMLSTIFSYSFPLSFKALFTKIIKNILMFFIISVFIKDRGYLKMILLLFIVSSIVIIVDSGFQLLRGTDILRHNFMYANQLTSSFSNPNSLGGWLIVVICIMFGIFNSNIFSTKTRVLSTMIFVILIALLIMTRSRGSWLGLFMSFIFIAFQLFKKYPKKRKKIVVFLIILSAIIVLIALPQNIKLRAYSMLSLENSSLFRINLWKEAIEIIEDFPLFGTGLNTYSKVAPNYTMGDGGYYPHNSYLQMAAEIGILGLLAFLWFIFSLFKLGIRTVKNTKDYLLLGFLGALLAFLVHSFFDVNLYALQLATLFWFVLGLTMARINMLINIENPTT